MDNMLTLESLNNCFEMAEETNAGFVAIRIAIGLSKEEVIINPRENFVSKKAYLNQAYNENLRHKFAGDEDIRVTGFTFGDTYAELEEKLYFYQNTGNLI